MLFRSKRMTMQTLDFAPLYRATVGFDRIADLIGRVLATEVAQPTYPPLVALNSALLSVAVEPPSRPWVLEPVL